jgi:MYXO-CTERM domain-containing protein
VYNRHLGGTSGAFDDTKNYIKLAALSDAIPDKPPGPGPSVPEPTALGLAAIGLLGLRRSKKKARYQGHVTGSRHLSVRERMTSVRKAPDRAFPFLKLPAPEVVAAPAETGCATLLPRLRSADTLIRAAPRGPTRRVRAPRVARDAFPRYG